MATTPTRPLLGHHTVLSELASLPEDTAESLVQTCKEVADYRSPTDHPNAIPMSGHTDLFRVRDGYHRALCDKHLGQIRVLAVGHRENIYEKTELAKQRARHR